MSEANIQQMILSALGQLLSDPARASLIWRRLPAIVDDDTDQNAVMVTFAGADGVSSVPVVSLIGPVSNGDLVMVDCVPPAGAYIIGQQASSPFWNSSWIEYDPATSGGGTATFQVLSGRYRRLGPKTVAFNIFIDVDNAGSGASVFQVELPTEPDRTIRQVFVGSAEGGTALSGLHGLLILSGTGNFIDRIRYAGATNVTGADLTSGKFFTISGVYEEA